ncbi:MAG TPA: histidine kinase [Bdellovibrionota bacterium]|nr:histidine kinase [Bdellovibrionota bacterium]
MQTGSGIILTNDQMILVTALIKIGLMAAMATVLSRFDTFKRMFFLEREGVKGRIYFIALMGGLFSLGVLARILLGYVAADMGLEGSLLGGLVAGSIVGMTVGLAVSLPAVAAGEYGLIPIAVVAGLAGGLLHHFCYRQRQRISFSPLTLVFFRRYREDQNDRPHLRYDLRLLIVIVALSVLELGASKVWGRSVLFTLIPTHSWTLAALLIGKAAAIGVPLMIWDHTYVEMALAERERGIVQARLDALKSKIQPHFLFNTLNTIASLIRIDPPKARTVLQKLAQILRAILDTNDDFRPLEEELRFTDDFLDIERARFGEERIRVHKNVDPALLRIHVPSLLIQPIVENSVIHGLKKKSGTIRISAQKSDEYLHLIVEDDGVGISAERLSVVKNSGIGLSNVNERLHVLYGSDFDFDVESEPGKGTRVSVAFPLKSTSSRIAGNA